MVQYQRAKYFPFLSAGVGADYREAWARKIARPIFFPWNQEPVQRLLAAFGRELGAGCLGRVRRPVQCGTRGTAQASAADVVNVQLLLQAELALDYFQMRGLDAEQTPSWTRPLQRKTGGPAADQSVVPRRTGFATGCPAGANPAGDDACPGSGCGHCPRPGGACDRDPDRGTTRVADRFRHASCSTCRPRFRRVCLRSCWNGARI